MNQLSSASLRDALLGGIAGAAGMTLFVYGFAPLAGLQVGDAVRFLGGLFTAAGVVAPSPANTLAAGAGVFIAMALVWAALYAYVSRGVSLPAWKKGLLYGGVVWLLSTVVIWPLLASVAATPLRPGFFALGFGGTAASVISFLAHLLYGVILATTVAVLETRAAGHAD